MLVEAGADYKTKSFVELTAMHCAAQNDNPWPIVYLYTKLGMDIDQRDSDGNTPLHWASFSNSFYAASYLLKWTKAINTTNSDGQTPLHLAVKTALCTGETKLVRLLCFNGAERNSTDISNNKAIDYVLENNPEQNHLVETKQELIRILKEQNECMCLMVRVPITKLHKSFKFATFFGLFHIVLLLSTLTLIIPRISFLLSNCQSHEQSFVLITLLLFIVNVILFFVCIVSDPGTHKRSKEKLTTLLSKVSCENLCAVCEVIQTVSTRHCVICNKCIEHYDHHCPWINNCIGTKNHNRFFIFLITNLTQFFLSLSLNSIALIVILSNKKHKYCNSTQVIPYDLVCNCGEIVGFMVELLLCGIELALGFGILLAGALLIVQIGNYTSGKTTNERFGVGSKLSKGRSNGYISNCMNHCKNTDIITQEGLLQKYGRDELDETISLII
jgi:palmitoyltransferase